MADPISKYDDIIDSRQVIERIDELTEAIGETDACVQADGDECHCGMPLDSHDVDEERDELAALKALAEEASTSPDWTYGEALVRDSYFKTYAEELADDIGAVDQDLSNRWPYTYIDWEQAARELQQDYMAVDYDGVMYWIRV